MMRSKEREELLDKVLEWAIDGWWDWNIFTGHVFFSPQWAKCSKPQNRFMN